MSLKILIMDPFGKTDKIESVAVPRVGDQVSWKYKPNPKVINVVWYCTVNDVFYDAVVVLE